MSSQKLTLLRLQKQEKKLIDEPIENVMVTRKGLLEFHFCIHSLKQPYQGGFYHGVLTLHQDYPFSPPKLHFITPTGRFQREKSICTTFTNFHKQTWTSAWNVRTMLMATVSFMLQESSGLGSINEGYGKRENYAKQSLGWNMKNNKDFQELFAEKIKKLDKKSFEATLQNADQIQSQKLDNEVIPQYPKAQASNRLYMLYLALILAVVMYALLKN